MIREKVMVGDMIRGVIRATEIDGVVICALAYETSAHTRVGGLELEDCTGCFFFFTGPPLKKLKYGKGRLGEVRCI